MFPPLFILKRWPDAILRQQFLRIRIILGNTGRNDRFAFLNLGGDLLIQVIIDTPQVISPEQETLFRALAEIERKEVGPPPKKSFFHKLKDWIVTDEKK